MKKYKLNKSNTKKPLSEEEISGFKDFNSLQKQYNEITKPGKPLYKRPFLFFILVLIILLALLLSGEI